MRALAIVVLLAACGSEATPMAPEQCGDIVCMGNETCDRTAGEPACIDGSADADGDGVRNADDLCPNLPNEKPYDEDGDGIGDQCDPCPIAKPAEEPDPDGDAVEGACDPDRTTPGDKILAFAGFRENPPWTLPSGWVVQGGELVATVPSVSPGFLSIPIIGTNHLAVETSYRIDSIVTAGNATPSVSTVTRDKRPAGETLMTCGVAKVSGTERVQISTGVESMNAIGTNLFDPASLYLLGFSIEGGQTACAVVANAQTMKSTSARAAGEQMTEAGLDVANATARFQWVMVIGR